MPLRVTYYNPNLPSGKKVATNVLGIFFNGEPKELTLEEEQKYYDVKGFLVQDHLYGLFDVTGDPLYAAPDDE